MLEKLELVGILYLVERWSGTIPHSWGGQELSARATRKGSANLSDLVALRDGLVTVKIDSLCAVGVLARTRAEIGPVAFFFGTGAAVGAGATVLRSGWPEPPPHGGRPAFGSPAARVRPGPRAERDPPAQ